MRCTTVRYSVSRVRNLWASAMLLCALPLARGNAASVLVADIHGVIAPVTVEIVAHALDDAARNNNTAVLLRFDTPGGLMESMRNITQRIIASPVTVIGYVAPGGARAASDGF